MNLQTRERGSKGPETLRMSFMNVPLFEFPQSGAKTKEGLKIIRRNDHQAKIFINPQKFSEKNHYLSCSPKQPLGRLMSYACGL